MRLVTSSPTTAMKRKVSVVPCMAASDRQGRDSGAETSARMLQAYQRSLWERMVTRFPKNN